MNTLRHNVRFLLVAAFLAAIGLLGMNRWAETRLAEGEQRINLSPVAANVDGLSDDAFDSAQVREFAEFSLGSEDDPLVRERWFWEQRAYPLDTIPAEEHRTAINQELAAGEQRDAAGADEWKSLGPEPLNDISYAGQSEQDASGRALAVALDPADPQTILLGAAQGGIWKSTDDGKSFKAVADNVPSLAAAEADALSVGSVVGLDVSLYPGKAHGTNLLLTETAVGKDLLAWLAQVTP